jgi:hypothetical protein
MPFSVHEDDEDPAAIKAPLGSTIVVRNTVEIMREARVDFILAQIKREVMRAARKHPAMNSPHEGYAVILEELDELWEHVKSDTGKSVAAGFEALQVAAMGVRYLNDVLPRDTLPYLEKR